MTHLRPSTFAAAVIVATILGGPVLAQQPQPAPTSPPQAAGAATAPDLGLRVELEPKAIELLKAMSDKLSAAKAMTFTAVATYESPDRTGEPLAYTTLSEVTLQRPDKLKVITPGDGPPSEFYYDGKTAMAYEPQAGLVAVAQVPPTIDAMLKSAYDTAAIYFPFTDVIVADPYKDIAGDLKIAFMIGQSRVVGGVATDIVGLVTNDVHMQVWIGTDDKLPRMMRATFAGEPGAYRHLVEFSNWNLNPTIAPDAFASSAAANAKQIEFARPDRVPAAATGK
ncbi:MAG TPA: DUF2092 domain-containing protein [Acetobacteraceae bacterium]|nr:DUF2092 domain-containing protein [Acetobacteraceae bacterium]